MLSVVEKALLIKLYYKNAESATAALRAYRSMKGKRSRKGPITPSALIKMMKKFESTGSLASRPRSGRPSTTAAVVTTVEQTVQSMSAISAHGESSAREVSRQTGVSYGSVWRALRITLKMYPYKLQHNQELKPPDFDSRRDFANWVFNKMDEQHDWLHTVLWTDEAHFTLSGAVNTHNCRVWTTENPHAFVEIPLHQPKVTVWCGFTADFIIGPFFFEEVTQTGFKTVSVTGQRYAAMLQNNIIPELQARQALQTVTFMQDGAPPHIALSVQHLLRSTFGEDRIISRCFNQSWPPRSPDLTPCDFWLWPFLKSKVYRDQPASLAALKDAIRQNVSAITQEMLLNAVNGVVTRLTAILLNDGQHIENLL